MDRTELFNRLARSAFRSRFRLGPRERAYCIEKGPDIIERHARVFIVQRLAQAQPENDGRQTPMRGHPVFIAQHATACCCRGCLQKWHGITRGRALSEPVQAEILAVLMAWIEQELAEDRAKYLKSSPEIQLSLSFDDQN